MLGAASEREEWELDAAAAQNFDVENDDSHSESERMAKPAGVGLVVEAVYSASEDRLCQTACLELDYAEVEEIMVELLHT